MQTKQKKMTGYGRTTTQQADVMRAQTQQDLSLSFSNKQPFVTHAKGLSYGDCALGNHLLDTSFLNRFIDINEQKKQLVVEPQVSFLDTLCLTQNLQLPVFPGTLHASLAGGIANDVHGKNHLHRGSLGNHITFMELILPQGRVRVSKTENSDLFYATIGGLGLTGIICQLGIQCLPKASTLQVQKVCFSEIKTGIELLIKQAKQYEYTAMWCDMFDNGRGILQAANPVLAAVKKNVTRQITLPFSPPVSLISKPLMKVFNRCYYQWQQQSTRQFKQSLIEFNNPLDKIKRFNYLYGPKGFYQLQCVVPDNQAIAFAESCLKQFRDHERYPTLTVIKKLGDESCGLLSFAQKGITFAFDFMAKDKAMVIRLHDILLEHGGRIYLAKDQLLSAKQFETMYPNHEEFKSVLEKYHLGKHFQSAMSQRLGIHA